MFGRFKRKHFHKCPKCGQVINVTAINGVNFLEWLKWMTGLFNKKRHFEWICPECGRRNHTHEMN